jgi:hypothetical protein
MSDGPVVRIASSANEPNLSRCPELSLYCRYRPLQLLSVQGSAVRTGAVSTESMQLLPLQGSAVRSGGAVSNGTGAAGLSTGGVSLDLQFEPVHGSA